MRYRLTLAAAAGTALASTALYALFDGLAWFWAGVGAIALVAGIGMATRLRPLPVIACVLADLAGLVLYLNVLFASARSWLLVVPSFSSLSYLAQLTTQGMTDADRFSPPVPLTPGLMLLSTAGIGLAALATDTVAVRLRSSAVAGLALLALFIVPSTTPAARSGLGTTIVFCLGTCGYLLILAADGRERIHRWGRTVSLWRADAYSRNGMSRAPGRPRTSEVRALASAGRRVGAASIVVALCVPLFVPGFRVNRMFPAHVNIFGPAASALGGSGSGVPNPLAVMSQDLREAQPSVVLTYRSTDPQPQYLQMYTLGDLSTTAWTMGPFLGATTTVTGKLAPPQGLTDADRTTVTTHVTISKGAASASSGMSFLPVPYPATAISVPGRWVNNVGTSMVVGFDTSLSGLGYTVTSDDIDPTVQQLTRAPAPPAAIADEYLNVPSAFRSLTALARKVTANAATPYAKAIALQNWFADSGQFSYSLSATEPPDASGLSHFLTVSRRGYCQQFAFAMAVLARLLGIPSRVAIGFTAGSQTGINTWEVKTSDAHAWPELYFQGAGWLRFEPTPTGSAGQGTATPPTYTVSPTDPAGGRHGHQPGRWSVGHGNVRHEGRWRELQSGVEPVHRRGHRVRRRHRGNRLPLGTARLRRAGPAGRGGRCPAGRPVRPAAEPAPARGGGGPDARHLAGGARRPRRLPSRAAAERVTTGGRAAGRERGLPHAARCGGAEPGRPRGGTSPVREHAERRPAGPRRSGRHPARAGGLGGPPDPLAGPAVPGLRVPARPSRVRPAGRRRRPGAVRPVAAPPLAARPR